MTRLPARRTTLAWLLLLGCAVGGHQIGRDPARDAALAAYLDTATHLSAEERRQMERHQPFEGMTLREAGLAMVPLETEMTVDERVRQATFAGNSVAYRVSFAGAPERVVDWVVASDVVLPEADTFQPNPPLP